MVFDHTPDRKGARFGCANKKCKDRIVFMVLLKFETRGRVLTHHAVNGSTFRRK